MIVIRTSIRAFSAFERRLSNESDTIVLQDVLKYEIEGEDDDGKIIGRHRGLGIGRPRFWERAAYYNMERELAEALDSLNSA